MNSTQSMEPRPPTLGQMLLRMFQKPEQSRSAYTVEMFGWIDLTLGVLILAAPVFMANLLRLPTLSLQAANYVRLVGLLVSGLGMLYVVSGRLNARGFVFASLLDRPMVPVIMAVLWSHDILPFGLALAFSVSDFGGFLWTLSAWRAERQTRGSEESLTGQVAAGFFGFTSGVLRGARTFHPDGRVFLGSVRSLSPEDPSFRAAASGLAGTSALMRIGMGVMKRGMPHWLAKWIPDAPSISARFFTPTQLREVRLQRQPGQDLDLLCTAGGDRLWKLLLNLMAGGRWRGLHQFDYARNVYFANVPYWIDQGREDVWLRFVPGEGWRHSGDQREPLVRETGLTAAVAAKARIRIEAQKTRGWNQPFVPIAEIFFEEEIEPDQEALHYDPVAGRGFTPHGLLTEVRRSVYPASVLNRPASTAQRAEREHGNLGARLARYLGQAAYTPLEGGDEMAGAYRGGRRVLSRIAFAVLALVVVFGVYMGVRLTQDSPVEYPHDDLMHFKYGSTGGERTMGIPYWFWVALPEIFPESLPGKKAGQGYQSFGMVYEKGVDPVYGLPVGVSMRHFRGIDVVYLNCAVCHTGTVRNAPGAEPVVVAGMPANTLNLGAFEKFLTDIPKSQKFTPQRIADQIAAMQSSPHRLIEAPDLINRLIFKFYAVYVMREKMLMLGDRLSFIHAENWGPGRVDTFNAPKALMNFYMKNADKRELIGNADFPSIWNQGPRETMFLHWDGNNKSVDERNLSAAFGTGAYPSTIDADLVLRTSAWLKTEAKPPKYLYDQDPELAQQGAPIYKKYCARCHGTRDAPFRSGPEPTKDELVGTVDPIDEIGTDRYRLDSYTYEVAANQSTLYAGFEPDWGFKQPYPHRFRTFHKTQGYANMPLDGIWLRGPYLHNGSVPNLRELLEPKENRSKVFYRGNDVYDKENIGFVATVPDAANTPFFRFDTSCDGNGNQGHEGKAYGTDLPPAEKRALLEYLKTF